MLGYVVTLEQEEEQDFLFYVIHGSSCLLATTFFPWSRCLDKLYGLRVPMDRFDYSTNSHPVWTGTIWP